MKIVIFFWILLINFAEATDSIEFKIKKDEHSSSPVYLKLFIGKSIQFQAVFNESAKYIFEGEASKNQSDVNKLFGFSDCSDSHMENSARFGWRWFNNELQILAFTHKDGKFSSTPMGAAEFNKVYNYSISLSNDKTKYIYKFNNKTIEMDRGCSSNKAKGYLLKPYFGGDQVAPHDIKIKIAYDSPFANFFADKIFPNPTIYNYVYTNLDVEEDLQIKFEIINLLGQIVKVTEPVSYQSGSDYQKVKIEFPDTIANGVYLIRPIGIYPDGTEKPGMVSSSGDAFKVVVQK